MESTPANTTYVALIPKLSTEIPANTIPSGGAA